VPWATSLTTLRGGAASTGAGALPAELLALNAPFDAPEPIVLRRPTGTGQLQNTKVKTVDDFYRVRYRYTFN